MDGVGISIIERPRPSPGHDTPPPAPPLRPQMRRALYDVFWKVKNVGPEAERRNQIRAQICARGLSIVEIACSSAITILNATVFRETCVWQG